MAVDPRAEPLRQPIDRALEAGIIESLQSPAAIADQVMVMVATQLDSFEAGLTVAHRQSLDETVLGQ